MLLSVEIFANIIKFNIDWFNVCLRDVCEYSWPTMLPHSNSQLDKCKRTKIKIFGAFAVRRKMKNQTVIENHFRIPSFDNFLIPLLIDYSSNKMNNLPEGVFSSIFEIAYLI